MKRREMLSLAEELLIDARDKRQRIALEQPDRLPTAQLMVDDAVRAYSILETRKRPGKRDWLEIAARYTRATLLSEALSVEAQ